MIKNLFFFLLSFQSLAWADSGSFPRPQVYTSGQAPGGQFNTVQEVCDAGIQNLNDAPDPWNPIYTLSGSTASTCTYSAIYTTSGYPNHTFTGSFSYSFSYTSCPSGSIANGTNCDYTCPNDETWNTSTNSCSAPPPEPTDCTDLNGIQSGSYKTSNSISSYCVGGCNVKITDSACGKNPDGTYKCASTGRFTGTSCEDPDPEQPTNDPKYECLKAGKSYGTVNGAVVCMNKDSAGSEPVTTTKDGEKSTTIDGQTTTEKTTTKDNGDGTVTRTTLTTNPDGTTTTKETQEDKPSFCESNPMAPMCKEEDDKCKKNPELAGCQTLGEVTDDQDLTTNALSFNITPANMPSASGCPVDKTINIGGRVITLSYANICMWVGSFRLLVLIFAYLSAAYIIYDAVRKS